MTLRPFPWSLEPEASRSRHQQHCHWQWTGFAYQGVLDTGKKLSDDNTIGQEEIQQRLAQFVEHWKELKQLAAAR